jgi:hypothetical protein
MKLGDQIAKWYRGELRPEEIFEVQLRLNALDDHDLVTASWIGPNRTLRVLSAWLGRTLIDMAGIQSNTEQDTNSFTVSSGERIVNGETLGAGDILIGDNSTGQPNLFWDASQGIFKLRNGTIQIGQMNATELMTGAGARVFRDSNFTVPSGSLTAIEWTGESYDDLGFVDLGTSDTKVTIPADAGGRYEVGFYAIWDTGNVGTMQVRLNLSGGSGPILVSVPNSNAGGGCGGTVDVELAASDYVEVYALQTSGTDKDIRFHTNEANPAFWVRRIR